LNAVAGPAPDEYPRLALRRRMLVLLLAVATALAIVLLLLLRPGDPKRDALRAARKTPAPAASGAASGVGGKAEVMLLPSGASAPR
jgi:hypothetical protein